jgi:adenylate kinase family enzyme
MKKIITLFVLLVSQSVFANEIQDSLLLRIDKRDQKIIGNPSDQGRPLKEEIEKLFLKKNIVLTDSIWQNIRTMIRSESDTNNELIMNIGNQKVQIAILKREDYRTEKENLKKDRGEREERESSGYGLGDDNL